MAVPMFRSRPTLRLCLLTAILLFVTLDIVLMIITTSTPLANTVLDVGDDDGGRRQAFRVALPSTPSPRPRVLPSSSSTTTVRPPHKRFVARDPQRALATNYNMSLLPPNDSSTLLNMTNFEFIHNHPDMCHVQREADRAVDGDNDDIFLLIFIHSAIDNVHKRRTIRRTWGNVANFHLTRHRIKMIFLLGITSDLEGMAQVREENARHQDIVQGSFVDSYRNMTYKHVMGLKWVTYHCRTARFVFKTDDDIFVDLLQLIDFLNVPNNVRMDDFLACYLYPRSSVSRSDDNKWHVTVQVGLFPTRLIHLNATFLFPLPQEYSSDYYPKYCAGWGIIMSPGTVFNLYRIARSRPYFWIDDVFISGILAQDLNLTHLDLGASISLDGDAIQHWLTSEPPSLPPLFGLPDTPSEQIEQMWNKAMRYYVDKFNGTMSL